MAGPGSLAKRLFDIAASLAALFVLSPLLLVIAIIVRAGSPGPALFSQMRTGMDGREFRMIKFRSMTVAAPGATGPGVTRKGDARITRAGRFLRKWKLDELPQLWNVLRGDMSIVGPRPESPRLAARYTDRQRAILTSARPGITDIATLVFRNEEELLERAEDTEAYYLAHVVPRKMRLAEIYVRNQSFLLDMKIIAMTIARILFPGSRRCR